MNRPIIGLSSCGKRLNEELFKSYISSGITHMEISEGKAACEAMDFDRIAELAKNSGVILWSFHLPFAPFSEIDISNPDLAGATVDYYLGLIKKATAIGIEKFIVHPSGEPISPEDRPLRLACAKEHLALLAQKAAELGAVICVEDLPRTCLGNCSGEMLELLSAHSALRSCFDTNHMLSEDLVSYANAVGDKIVTLHVSDYDFANERPYLTVNFDCGFDDYFIIHPQSVDPASLVLQESEVQAVRFADCDEILNMIDSGEFIPYRKSLIRLLFDFGKEDTLPAKNNLQA